MNGTAQVGWAVEALVFFAAAFLIRFAVTGGEPNRHRARRQKPVEEYVPGHHLIPALAGRGWPQPAFRHCIECRATVPVVVHDQAHRCDWGHTTIHTTTGSCQ